MRALTVVGVPGREVLAIEVDAHLRVKDAVSVLNRLGRSTGPPDSLSCSGLQNPDTKLGENGRHKEGSDEQATTYVFPEFKQQAACLVLDQGYSHMEASRSVGLARRCCVAGCSNCSWNARASRHRGRQSPAQQHIQELKARIERLEREKTILKKLPRS